ncbi:MAG: fibronectin type III domain-containing protein [Tepidisphaeraceae bacterium]
MTDLSSQYNFTLTTPALLTATMNAHAVTLYRGNTKLVSGDPISRAIPAGRYSVVVTGGFSGATATLGVSRTAAPTRLQADVWGGGAIHLNWDDNSSDEAQYRVDRWTKLGWRRSVRVGADATAAVIDHLVPGAATTYRASAVTADGASVRSANIVSATTAAQDTSGWYQVKLSAGTRGEAGWTLAKDILSNSEDPVTVGQEQSLTDLPDPKP